MGRNSVLGNAWLILVKDFREYYGKAPTLSWGILFPMAIVVLLGYYSGAYGPWRTIPGLISIALLFSSSTMPQVSVGFDKMSGGLNLFVYSPVRVSSLILGKALGGVIFGLLGSGIAVGLLFFMGASIPFVHPLYLLLGVLFGSIIFSFIAVILAFLFPATQSVAVLNILRFSMIFLGGVFFPKVVMPSVLLPVVYSLPIVYVNELVRLGSFNLFDYVDPVTSVLVLVVYMVFVVVLSFVLVRKAVFG